MTRGKRFSISQRSVCGATLVELLVALPIMVLAAGAALSLFLSLHRLYLIEERGIDLHQNVRAALGMMERELRGATDLLEATTGAKEGSESTRISFRKMGGWVTYLFEPAVRGGREPLPGRLTREAGGGEVGGGKISVADGITQMFVTYLLADGSVRPGPGASRPYALTSFERDFTRGIKIRFLASVERPLPLRREAEATILLRNRVGSRR